MRTRHFLLLTPLLVLLACGNPIKNENAKVEVEPGTEVLTDQSVEAPAPEAKEKAIENETPAQADPIGYWVGDFRRKGDEYNDKGLFVDEGFYWNRNNKINISIDSIKGEEVFGHSVVAGNDRPFTGTRSLEEGKYTYQVKEPGDDRYDGAFTFRVIDGLLEGEWEAYKNIDIKHREFTLSPRTFTYDPSVMLESNQRFIDWTNNKETREEYEIDGEMEEWISQQFAAATHLIYEINASNRLLTKEEVENLKRGDLTIIRNSIYARHGYSFKNRPLRVYFDAQSWYIPVHADIRADFTEIEKQNIQLMLRYEENAAEYYDYFGRG